MPAQVITTEDLPGILEPLLKKIAELESRLPATDSWLDLMDAAPLMNQHYTTLYRWIHNGQLKEGVEWRRKPQCKKGYQIERAFAENYQNKEAA